MAMAAHLAMPGTFNNTPTQHTVGRKSNIFQPPRTPSVASSLELTTSIISESTQRSTLNRKRSRRDYSAERDVTPVSMIPSWTNSMEIDPMAQSGSMDPGSPTPFVNTRYQLAGGLDTPAAAAARYGEESELSDINYRRGLISGKRVFESHHTYSYFPPLPDEDTSSTLKPGPDGLPRISSPPQPSGSHWSTTALNVVGAVAGKVWEFCKAGAFRGFTAGGGTKYEVTSHPTLTAERDFWQDENFEKSSGTTVPGQFHEEDFIVDYLDRTITETPDRPSKRRHVDSDDGLGKNWIMVSTPPTNLSTPSHIRPPTGRYGSVTTSSGRRTTLSHVSNARPASRANVRRTLIPSQASRVSTVSQAGSPAIRFAQQASYASPRSPGGSRIPVPTSNSTKVTNLSPAAIEAQKWAARKKKEERETDDNMRRLNSRLRDMIREGKEALGTKVEVGDEGEECGEVVVI